MEGKIEGQQAGEAAMKNAGDYINNPPNDAAVEFGNPPIDARTPAEKLENAGNINGQPGARIEELAQGARINIINKARSVLSQTFSKVMENSKINQGIEWLQRRRDTVQRGAGAAALVGASGIAINTVRHRTSKVQATKSRRRGKNSFLPFSKK